jgi:hypothetical protein
MAQSFYTKNWDYKYRLDNYGQFILPTHLFPSTVVLLKSREQVERYVEVNVSSSTPASKTYSLSYPSYLLIQGTPPDMYRLVHPLYHRHKMPYTAANKCALAAYRSLRNPRTPTTPSFSPSGHIKERNKSFLENAGMQKNMSMISPQMQKTPQMTLIPTYKLR